MNQKLENLGINGSANEITEYINRCNSWIDTRETFDVREIKGASLQTLVSHKTLNDASITEIQETLLRRVRPAQLELVKRVKFYMLVRNHNETVCDSVVRLQRQASKCNFHEQTGITLVAAYTSPHFRDFNSFAHKQPT